MSYHGLGAAPSWCPPSTYNRDNPQRDPCEIGYKVDLPIIGEEVIKLPVNQLINDIRVQLDKDLPGIVDNVWTTAQPKINDLVADIEAEMDRYIPEVAAATMKSVVMPAMDQRITEALVEGEMLRDEALKAALAIAATLVLAVGTAAWWIKKG